jgi:hypothetical protein
MAGGAADAQRAADALGRGGGGWTERAEHALLVRGSEPVEVAIASLVERLRKLGRHRGDFGAEHAVWQNDELLAVVARALRLAQSDEWSALVTPAGEIASMLWPVVQTAAKQLGLTVRFAHGLGLAESLATCLQLPLPPTVELRARLSDFVGQTQLPTLAIASEIGELTDITALYDGNVRFFAVDLYAQQHKVVNIDIQQIERTAPKNALFVAARGAVEIDLAHTKRTGLIEPLESALLWAQLLHGLTESVRG